MLFVIYLIVLGLTQIQAQSQQCNETHACRGTEIDGSDIVTCPGYGSCSSATMTNIESYVVCAGYRGCKYASIETDGYVKCTGLEGCAETTKLNPATYLICSSYKSCYNSVASVGGSWVRCNGHAACQSMTGEIYAPEITCSGAKGCYASTLTAKCSTGTNVSVSGYLGGQLMNLDFEDAIEATNFIHANGESSLTSATIYSGESNTLDMFIGGYLTGTGLEINCESSSTCNLNCYGFGCPDVTFNCATDAQCNVDCSNVPTTDYCPTVTTSSAKISEKKQNMKKLKKLKRTRNHVLSSTSSINKNNKFSILNNVNLIMIAVSFISGVGVAGGAMYFCNGTPTENKYKEYQIIH